MPQGRFLPTEVQCYFIGCPKARLSTLKEPLVRRTVYNCLENCQWGLLQHFHLLTSGSARKAELAPIDETPAYTGRCNSRHRRIKDFGSGRLRLEWPWHPHWCATLSYSSGSHQLMLAAVFACVDAIALLTPEPALLYLIPGGSYHAPCGGRSVRSNKVSSFLWRKKAPSIEEVPQHDRKLEVKANLFRQTGLLCGCCWLLTHQSPPSCHRCGNRQ